MFLISWYKKTERDILRSHAIYNIEFVMHPVCMDAIAEKIQLQSWKINNNITFERKTINIVDSSSDWLKVSIVPLIFNNDSWPAQFYKLIRQDVKCNWMVATSLVSPNMDTAGGNTICTTDKAHVAKFPLRKDDIESYS